MSRHVGIVGLPEFTYESSIVLNMAALRSITFEDSLCVQQKEAISNIIVLDTLIILPHRSFLLSVQDFIVRKLTNEEN